MNDKVAFCNIYKGHTWDDLCLAATGMRVLILLCKVQCMCVCFFNMYIFNSLSIFYPRLLQYLLVRGCYLCLSFCVRWMWRQAGEESLKRTMFDQLTFPLLFIHIWNVASIVCSKLHAAVLEVLLCESVVFCTKMLVFFDFMIVDERPQCC